MKEEFILQKCIAIDKIVLCNFGITSRFARKFLMYQPLILHKKQKVTYLGSFKYYHIVCETYWNKVIERQTDLRCVCMYFIQSTYLINFVFQSQKSLEFILLGIFSLKHGTNWEMSPETFCHFEQLITPKSQSC